MAISHMSRYCIAPKAVVGRLLYSRGKLGREGGREGGGDFTYVQVLHGTQVRRQKVVVLQGEPGEVGREGGGEE